MILLKVKRRLLPGLESPRKMLERMESSRKSVTIFSIIIILNTLIIIFILFIIIKKLTMSSMCYMFEEQVTMKINNKININKIFICYLTGGPAEKRERAMSILLWR